LNLFSVVSTNSDSPKRPLFEHVLVLTITTTISQAFVPGVCVLSVILIRPSSLGAMALVQST